MGQIRALFRALAEAGLVVNLQKCEFMKSRVEYLGHVVGQGQVRPRQAKVQAIAEFPLPTTKREILRFLGVSGFYRKFCRNYSTVAAPLTDLLKKGVPFKWTNDCQESFNSLKVMLMHYPVLVAPDFGRQFKLAVDACDVGVGAVLMQDHDDILQPVAYFSRKLNKHQSRYSTIEKETLALVLAVQHFEIYLTNGTGEILVYTDHNPLVFLRNFKDKNSRLCRWCWFLQAFPLRIEHIPGKRNVIADSLSRSPVQ